MTVLQNIIRNDLEFSKGLNCGLNVSYLSEIIKKIKRFFEIAIFIIVSISFTFYIALG